MRAAAIIALVLSSWPALAETPQRPRQEALSASADELPAYGMRHHQPSAAEVDEREDARLGPTRTPAGASRSAARTDEATERRFLDACMTRLHLDEPLGSERNHRGFCTCRMEALERANPPAALDALALNIEERNAAKVTISRLPADTDRTNQAAILACMGELSW